MSFNKKLFEHNQSKSSHGKTYLLNYQVSTRNLSGSQSAMNKPPIVPSKRPQSFSNKKSFLQNIDNEKQTNRSAIQPNFHKYSLGEIPSNSEDTNFRLWKPIGFNLSSPPNFLKGSQSISSISQEYTTPQKKQFQEVLNFSLKSPSYSESASNKKSLQKMNQETMSNRLDNCEKSIKSMQKDIIDLKVNSNRKFSEIKADMRVRDQNVDKKFEKMDQKLETMNQNLKEAINGIHQSLKEVVNGINQNNKVAIHGKNQRSNAPILSRRK